MATACAREKPAGPAVERTFSMNRQDELQHLNRADAGIIEAHDRVLRQAF